MYKVIVMYKSNGVRRMLCGDINRTNGQGLASRRGGLVMGAHPGGSAGSTSRVYCGPRMRRPVDRNGQALAVLNISGFQRESTLA